MQEEILVVTVAVIIDIKYHTTEGKKIISSISSVLIAK